MKYTQKANIRAAIISIIIGGIIVWILLSEIDLKDIPRAMGKIPLQSLFISFMLYAMAVFLKALRFKVILRADISIKQLFPIISLYTFFANILPMRAGELSYMYLLKKRARMSGTKSFASLIVGGIADFLVILVAMSIVGWHLRDPLSQGFSSFITVLRQKIEVLYQLFKDNIILFVISIVFLGVIIVSLGFILKRQREKSAGSRILRFLNLVRSKIHEVGHELHFVSFDFRLLIIIIFSILIISFRFATQWYLVRSMDIPIGIWEISFALLFGVLFSLVPIHGPAGFGTVEAPWVMSLLLLNVSRSDAITSGFGLHIIIIVYCVIMGLFGIIGMRFSRLGQIVDSKSLITNENNMPSDKV